MKILGREIVKLHYRDELNPEINYCHNSDQLIEMIADKVKELLDDSLFLQGPLDANVSFFLL